MVTALQLSVPPLVLLAEDDPDDAFFMERAFEESGVPSRLLVVPSGLETVNYLSGNDRYADRRTYPLPALLLLDLKMPAMNGFEVLEWIKGRSQFNELPIVVLSGSDFDDDVRKAKELGADDYRTKCSHPARLAAMLHELHTRWLPGPNRLPRMRTSPSDIRMF